MVRDGPSALPGGVLRVGATLLKFVPFGFLAVGPAPFFLTTFFFFGEAVVEGGMLSKFPADNSLGYGNFGRLDFVSISAVI